MALSKEQENFCKIAFLNVDVVTEALRALLDHHLTEYGCTLEKLLNTHQHKLFHLYVNKKCQSISCKHQIPDKRVLSKHQLSKLFNTSATTSTSPYKDFGNFTPCLAIKGLKAAHLDVSMLRVVLSLCCIDLFWKSCLAKEGKSLENFLNEHKHDLYHLWQSKTRCCKCDQYYKPPSDFSGLKKLHFEILFSRKVVHSCKAGTSCILCSCSVSPTLKESDIEDQIAIVVQDYFCPLKKNVNKLVDCRNNCYAHVSEAKFTDSTYNNIWTNVTNAIEQLSIHMKSKDALKQKITKVKGLLLNMKEYEKYKQLVQEQIEEDKEIRETLAIGLQTVTDRLDKIVCAMQKDRMNNSTEDPTKEKRIYEVCQPCNSQNKLSQAEFGCLTCVEVYCNQCNFSHSTYKAFKNHRLIGIQEYTRLNESFQKYDKVCNLHNKDLICYCSLHHSPVCVRCIQLNHSKCPSPVNIGDVATQLRSTNSDVLDKDFEEIDRTLKTLRQSTEGHLADLDGTGEEQNKAVTDLKMKIQLEFHAYLDHIEKLTRDSITENISECKSKLKISLKEINRRRESFEKLQEQWLLQKRNATDEESFFAIRDIQELLRDLDTKIQYLRDTYVDTSIEFIPDENFSEAIKTLQPNFGQINNVRKFSIPIDKLSFRRANMTQAQIQIQGKSKAETLEIEFAHQFIIPTKKSKGNMLNCTIVSGKYLVVADENNSKLHFFNTENMAFSEMATDHKPFDIVGMDDDVIVSYGDQNYIEIIQVSSTHFKKRDLGNNCLGLSVCDRIIYVITYPKGVTVLNDQIEVLREILMNVEGVCFLSVHSERLLYSSWKLDERIIVCSNMSGKQIWH
ncbi:Hypothetical predicted protein [Mytilus galloprovincialis]|uniref:B box-type domain-containing protein n=1 Tax=Mytilus galloprovincialis TaxID=29158 RepID=A0A8B6H4Y3_MYTGA|nr:Hypothetical predicted protein [Mytilus galloprovincialis]